MRSVTLALTSLTIVVKEESEVMAAFSPSHGGQYSIYILTWRSAFMFIEVINHQKAHEHYMLHNTQHIQVLISMNFYAHNSKLFTMTLNSTETMWYLGGETFQNLSDWFVGINDNNHFHLHPSLLGDVKFLFVMRT